MKRPARKTLPFPSPFQRLLRSKTTLTATVLVGMVGLAGAGMQSTSALLVQGTLDAHWRGPYDILVTADPVETPRVGTAVIVPDTASTAVGSHTLSFAQLAAVDGVDDVAIAAPLGRVAVPAQGLSRPLTLTVPLGEETGSEASSDAAAGTRAFAITTETTSGDGLNPTASESHTTYYLIDPSEWQGYGVEANDEQGTLRYRSLSQFGEAEIGADTDPQTAFEYIYYDEHREVEKTGDGAITIPLAVAPVQTGWITLVDPEAEQQLLGDAGDFLQPLVDSRDLIDRVTFPGTIDASTLDPTDDLKTLQDKGALQNISPIITRTDSAADVHLTVTMTELDVASEALPSLTVPVVSALETRPPEFPLEQVTAASPLPDSTVQLFDGQAGSALAPFSTSGVDLQWPETSAAPTPWFAEFPEFSPLSRGLTGITGQLQQGAPYTRVDADTLAQAPTGYRDPTTYIPRSVEAMNEPGIDLSTAAPPSETPASPADEPEYEQLTAATPTVDARVREFSKRPWPVGGYSVSDIHQSLDELSRSALGYNTLAPVLVNGAAQDGAAAEDGAAEDEATEDGGAAEGTGPVDDAGSAIPAQSGLGVNPEASAAIADITNAATWGIDDPITSIRVRVAGIGGYDDGAVQKIIAVAQDIRDHGLNATVLAGSSPQSINVAVQTGVSDTSAGASGAGASVATVSTERQWSSLGAAAAAKSGVSRATASTLLLAVAATTALLVAVQAGSVPDRRFQNALMRQLGWPRRRRIGWMAAEESVVLMALGGLAALAVALASQRALVAAAMAIPVGVAIVAAVAVVLAGSSRGDVARQTRRIPGAHRSTSAHNLRARSQSQARLRLRPRWRSSSRSSFTDVFGFARRQSRAEWSASSTSFLAALFLGVAFGIAVLAINDARAVAGQSLLGVAAIGQGLVPQGALMLITVLAVIVLVVSARRRDAVRRTEQSTALSAMGWTRRDVAVSRTVSLLISALPGTVVAMATVAIIAAGSPVAVILGAVGAALIGGAATYVVNVGVDGLRLVTRKRS
jgi:hypothetical protein